MELFFFFTIVWVLAWAIFLLSALAQNDGGRVHTHTLLDDIEITL